MKLKLIALIATTLLAGCTQYPKPGEVWAIRNYDDPWCWYPRHLVIEVKDGSVKSKLYSGRYTSVVVHVEPIRNYVGPLSSLKPDPHTCQPPKEQQ